MSEGRIPKHILTYSPKGKEKRDVGRPWKRREK
jgi:hypothetical protein